MTKVETSLTSPSDRKRENNWRPQTNEPPLSEEEAKVACQDLNIPVNPKYKTVDRVYQDPIMNFQKIGLISFVPADGATPNEHGIYGFCQVERKFRY